MRERPSMKPLNRGSRPLARPEEIMQALTNARAELPEGTIQAKDLAAQACRHLPVPEHTFTQFMTKRATDEERRLLGLPPRKKTSDNFYKDP